MGCYTLPPYKNSIPEFHVVEFGNKCGYLDWWVILYMIDHLKCPMKCTSKHVKGLTCIFLTWIRGTHCGHEITLVIEPNCRLLLPLSWEFWTTQWITVQASLSCQTWSPLWMERPLRTRDPQHKTQALSSSCQHSIFVCFELFRVGLGSSGSSLW